jgi:hypothetical protein
VLAISAKRHQPNLVCFLTRRDRCTGGRVRSRHLVGRRDHALLTLAVLMAVCTD